MKLLTNDSADTRGSGNRGRVTSSYGLAVADTHRLAACPSHKSPDQPSTVSPIYFTRWPVVLAIATRPLSTLVLSPYATRPTDLSLHTPTRIDALLRSITFLRPLQVLTGRNAGSPDIDTGFGSVRASATNLREKKERKEGKKIVKHRDHVRRTEDRTFRYETTKISTGFPCFFDDSRSTRRVRLLVFVATSLRTIGR